LGQRAEAEQQLRKGLAIKEQLVAEFPAVPAYRVELGGSYCNLGSLLSGGGQPSDGLEWFDKAIATLAPVHEREPRDVTARQFLRNSHLARAMVHNQLRQYAEAVPDLDRAVELSPPEERPGLRSTRATSRLRAGQVAEAVAEVAELAKLPFWDAGQLCGFAGAYAVASGKFADKKDEYAASAVELLQRAVKAGYKNTVRLKQDGDLAPLRDREDFQKLLADLETGKQ
jgi:tetratricopeptide (TPR) repeat protein